MCGRYSLATFQDQLAAEFDLIDVERIEPRYNIAPTQTAPVVRVTGKEGNRLLGALRWGLVPFWAKDPAIGNRMINARSEGVESKPSFRAPFKRQRCLIPTTGFFEWKRLAGGTRSKPNKQPYCIRMDDERVFAFAGLWDRWKDPDGEVIETYTILTTEPNDSVRPLHNRMPVILAPDDYAQWLDPEIQNPDALLPLLKPYADEDLIAYPVSKQVNNPKNDTPACVEELDG